VFLLFLLLLLLLLHGNKKKNSRVTKLNYSWFVFSQHHSFAKEIRV
jgi:hypothetical protein